MNLSEIVTFHGSHFTSKWKQYIYFEWINAAYFLYCAIIVMTIVLTSKKQKQILKYKTIYGLNCQMDLNNITLSTYHGSLLY